MSDKFKNIILQNGLEPSKELRYAFQTWTEEKYLQEFIDNIMDKAKIVALKINDISNPFHNGKKGSEYSTQIILPEIVKDIKFFGLEEIGLTYKQAEEPTHFFISGVPSVEGNQEIILEYTYDGWIEGQPKLLHKFCFAINPNPRELWKDKPVPDDIEYPKPDFDSDYIRVEASLDGLPRKDIVAASRRGRSHAHEGKPRDDHFLIRHSPESDWYILAVADGAGSAEFSREGSRIACNVAVDYCEKELKKSSIDFENEIEEFFRNQKESKEKNPFPALGNLCKKYAYEIIARGALQANKVIREEALSKNRQPKLYATTLLLTICKKFELCWFIISFNIGDGAIGVIYKNNDLFTSNLICKPDEGEFGGQTRFLTMNEIFTNYDDIMTRINVKFLKDFETVILMSDGISDAKFETDYNLNNDKKWIELWDDLKKNVNFEDDNEQSKNELLNWLNFWSQGNHDDRTIAILY